MVRVKHRIVEQHIPFELPGEAQLPQRLGYVLDAIYAAYGTGWNAAPELGGGQAGLRGEALWLAGQLVLLMPGDVVRAYPRSCWTMQARGHRGGDAVALGPYALDHTPWEQRTGES